MPVGGLLLCNLIILYSIDDEHSDQLKNCFQIQVPGTMNNLEHSLTNLRNLAQLLPLHVQLKCNPQLAILSVDTTNIPNKRFMIEGGKLGASFFTVFQLGKTM